MRWVRGLIQIRNLRESVRDDPHLSLGELMQRIHVELHGVHLGRPDWSEDSRSLALTATSLSGHLRMHFALNAWWEPLEFELPELDPTRWSGWLRVLDSGRPCPQDLVSLAQAEGVVGARHRVEPRSVTVLFAPGHAGAQLRLTIRGSEPAGRAPVADRQQLRQTQVLPAAGRPQAARSRRVHRHQRMQQRGGRRLVGVAQQHQALGALLLEPPDQIEALQRLQHRFELQWVDAQLLRQQALAGTGGPARLALPKHLHGAQCQLKLEAGLRRPLQQSLRQARRIGRQQRPNSTMTQPR
jgi:hypothetical protein